jgi:hypothetical protein
MNPIAKFFKKGRIRPPTGWERMCSACEEDIQTSVFPGSIDAVIELYSLALEAMQAYRGTIDADGYAVPFLSMDDRERLGLIIWYALSDDIARTRLRGLQDGFQAGAGI